MSAKSIVLTRVVGTKIGRIKAQLIKVSAIEYDLKLFSLKDSVKKEETKETETYIDKVEKLRPYQSPEEKELTLKVISNRQAKIDEFLAKHPSISEAITENEDGERPIELELKFPVERYLEETRKSREVPVVKDVITTKETAIETLKFYFRPSGTLLVKSVQNFAKSNKK